MIILSWFSLAAGLLATHERGFCYCSRDDVNHKPTTLVSISTPIKFNYFATDNSGAQLLWICDLNE